MTTINERLAEAVIDVLLDRKGFDDWWYDIDEEVRAEIITALCKKIGEVA